MRICNFAAKSQRFTTVRIAFPGFSYLCNRPQRIGNSRRLGTHPIALQSGHDPDKMKPDRLFTIFFSPTGTSRILAESVARGLADGAHRTIDLTREATSQQTLPAEAVAVVAVPVYGGRVAPLARERLKSLRGEGTPTVLLTVYGNRDIGGALAELSAALREQGFIPVAGGAFVGEHAYSTAAHPIAAGRPDADDAACAEAFGRAVRRKLAAGRVAPVALERLRTPRTPLLSMLRFVRFVLKYRRSQRRSPVPLLPVTDPARCIRCGRCVRLCPNGAIAKSDELHTDPARCIRCCACVKGCPEQARSFFTPFSEALARNFARRKQPVTML